MADGEDNMLNILAASGMRAGDHGSGATVRWRRSSASLLASELVEKVEKKGRTGCGAEGGERGGR
jgi:hypothetical protein